MPERCQNMSEENAKNFLARRQDCTAVDRSIVHLMSFRPCRSLPLRSSSYRPWPLPLPTTRWIKARFGSSSSHLPALSSGCRRLSSTRESVIAASSCLVVSVRTAWSSQDCNATYSSQLIPHLPQRRRMARLRSLSRQHCLSRIHPSQRCDGTEVDLLRFEAADCGVEDDPGQRHISMLNFRPLIPVLL